MNKINSDPNVYYSLAGNSVTILLFHVDDLFITRLHPTHISTLKSDLGREYKMTDLGLMKKFLKVEVEQTERNFLHRKDTKTQPTYETAYQALVGKLHYVI